MLFRSAVSIVLYELNKSSKKNLNNELKVFNLASSNEVHDTFVELEEMLLRVGYLLEHTSKAKISKFKNFILRANTSMHEINVLRGIVHQESSPEPPQKTEEKQQEKTEQPRDLPQAELKAEVVVKDEVETKPKATPEPAAPEENEEQDPEPPLVEQPLAEQPPAEQPSKSEAARPTPPTPAPGEPAEPQQPADEEPKLKPSSSLGGSARELLNSDGRLRKP